MRKIYKIIFAVLLIMSARPALALEAVSTDPRIRTFIYGKNDVFRITSTFGYQSVIELEQDEKILTISVGNPNIFKITPSMNRLFLKAMINGQMTNMTVITDKRTYQMDLSSMTDNPDDIMYVVRFIYPDEMQGQGTAMASTDTGTGQPMQLYSPIALPNVGGSMPAMPSMNMPSAPDADVPMSIRLRDRGERSGMRQSPLDIKTNF